MRATEQTRRRARGASLDMDLARRAERKLNRYHMDLNGVLAIIVDARGLLELPARRAGRQLADLRATAGRWDDGWDAGEIIAEIDGARTMERAAARRGEGVTRTEAGMTRQGKQEVAELSGPAKTRAEDSATFTGETVAYSAPEVKGREHSRQGTTRPRPSRRPDRPDGLSAAPSRIRPRPRRPVRPADRPRKFFSNFFLRDPEARKGTDPNVFSSPHFYPLLGLDGSVIFRKC